LWNSEEYIHQRDIDTSMQDNAIWKYATEKNLTIITKDSDFSDLVLYHTPPPKVIHFKFGNLKMDKFYKIISENWLEIKILSETHKLVNVFMDRIEGIN
jgi:predicted nuclease of predicted toxin-antitoxin system